MQRKAKRRELKLSNNMQIMKPLLLAASSVGTAAGNDYGWMGCGREGDQLIDFSDAADCATGYTPKLEFYNVNGVGHGDFGFSSAGANLAAMLHEKGIKYPCPSTCGTQRIDTTSGTCYAWYRNDTKIAMDSKEHTGMVKVLGVVLSYGSTSEPAMAVLCSAACTFYEALGC